LIEQGRDALQITLASKSQYRIRIEAAVVSGLFGLSALLFSDADVYAKLGVLVTTPVWRVCLAGTRSGGWATALAQIVRWAYNHTKRWCDAQFQRTY
jgi:hypothetical protein